MSGMGGLAYSNWVALLNFLQKNLYYFYIEIYKKLNSYF
jgi:hypothetical protein